MMVVLSKERGKVSGSLSSLKEASMKVTGKMIKCMALANFITQMEPSPTRDSGTVTSFTAKVKFMHLPLLNSYSLLIIGILTNCKTNG